MKIEQDKELSKDLQRMKKLLKLMPVERKPIGENLLKEIAFMASTLAKLKQTVEEKGVVDNFKQGRQQFMRESPALKAYNTTIQRYSLLYKQFTDLLPKPEAPDKSLEEIKALLKRLEDRFEPHP